MSGGFQILLVGNYLPDRQTSMQRFAEVLRAHLSGRGMAIDLIRPEPCFGRVKPGHAGLRKWLGYVDKFVIFPHTLRRRCREPRRCGQRLVVHLCDHSSSVYTRHLQRIPHVVTCHDVLAIRSARGEFAEHTTGWTGRWLQTLILQGLNRANHVACVSEATRADLLRVSCLERARVCSVYNGLNHPFSPSDGARAQSNRLLKTASVNGARTAGDFVDRRFVLHVGGNAWYKNRLGVLRIYSALLQMEPGAPHLIMVGEPFTPEMERFVQEGGLSGRVLSIVGCDTDDLRAFYSAAELLLFPSLAEGFGWPILEAQACGCRVVTTGRPPMAEVGGDAAAYCDPCNLKEVVALLSQVLQEPPEARRQRVGAGLANAARFSTHAMIDGYLELYQRLLN